jgi:stearoyl-CoA desaturase (delta-9 desaturase)
MWIVLGHVALAYLIVTLQWQLLLLALGINYLISIPGISMTYHRAISHNAVALPRWLEFIGLFLAGFSMQGSALSWSATHRQHHRYQGTEKDPHSPLFKSRWRIQFFSYFNTVKLPYIVDLGRSKLHLWFYNNYWYVNTVFVLLLGIISIDFLSFWIAVIGLTIFKLHIINSLSHATPKFLIPMEKDSTISNSLLLGLLFVNSGEAWHKNHHDDPKNARFGKQWYQIDIPFLLIKLLVLCNLATIE